MVLLFVLFFHRSLLKVSDCVVVESKQRVMYLRKEGCVLRVVNVCCGLYDWWSSNCKLGGGCILDADMPHGTDCLYPILILNFIDDTAVSHCDVDLRKIVGEGDWCVYRSFVFPPLIILQILHTKWD